MSFIPPEVDDAFTPFGSSGQLGYLFIPTLANSSGTVTVQLDTATSDGKMAYHYYDIDDGGYEDDWHLKLADDTVLNYSVQ